MNKALTAPTERDLDKIIRYLNDGEGRAKLSPELQKSLDRYDFTDNQIRKFKRKSKVLERIMLKFNVSRAFAERIYYETKEVFNSVPRCTKSYDTEFLIEQGWILYDKAMEAGDFKAAASVFKTLVETFDKHNDREIPVEIPQPSIIVMTADPAQLGLKPFSKDEWDAKFKKWTSAKRKVDLNIQDVEFTDMNNNDEA
jgi:hypothetical protein